MSAFEFYAVLLLAAGLLAYLAVEARREKRQRAFDRHVDTTITEGGDLA